MLIASISEGDEIIVDDDVSLSLAREQGLAGKVAPVIGEPSVESVTRIVIFWFWEFL